MISFWAKLSQNMNWDKKLQNLDICDGKLIKKLDVIKTIIRKMFLKLKFVWIIQLQVKSKILIKKPNMAWFSKFKLLFVLKYNF